MSVPKLTREQAAIISAFTGKMCCKNFSDFHDYVEKIMGRPVWTYEMGNEEIMAQIKEAARADFVALCGGE